MAYSTIFVFFKLDKLIGGWKASEVLNDQGLVFDCVIRSFLALMNDIEATPIIILPEVYSA